jgi:hypothetical protein
LQIRYQKHGKHYRLWQEKLRRPGQKTLLNKIIEKEEHGGDTFVVSSYLHHLIINFIYLE